MDRWSTKEGKNSWFVATALCRRAAEDALSASTQRGGYKQRERLYSLVSNG